MDRTKQIKRDAKQLFRLCLVNGLLDEDRTRAAVRRLIESKRRGYLALLLEFQRLLRLHRADHTAEVETAAPLPADLRAALQARLERVYGQDIITEFVETPALIAGMRIKVGSDVFDGSVQSELAALGQRLGITIGNGWNGRSGMRRVK